jgi:hypothetical protein
MVLKEDFLFGAMALSLTTPRIMTLGTMTLNKYSSALSTTTANIMTLSIITHGIMILIMTLSIITHGIMILIMTLSIMTLITTRNITTLTIMTLCTQCRLCRVSQNPIMLSVIIMSVVMLSRVTRLGDFLLIGLLWEAHCDFN